MPPLHFLRDLPREIRDQIYLEVLAPTGTILLHKNSSNRQYNISEIKVSGDLAGRINLSLLQVSRQIHAECKNILFHHNDVLLDPRHGVTHTHTYTWWLRDKIQRYAIPLNLQYDVWEKASQHSMEEIMKWLPSEAHYSGLESITFIIEYSRDHRIGQWTLGPEEQRKLRFMPVIMGYLSLFRWYFRIHQGLREVERRVIFDSRKASKNDADRISTQLEALAWKLHQEVGGELWSDGKLCYKNQVQLDKPFQNPPE